MNLNLTAPFNPKSHQQLKEEYIEKYRNNYIKKLFCKIANNDDNENFVIIYPLL